MTVEVPEGLQNTDSAVSLEFDRNSESILEHVMEPMSKTSCFRFTGTLTLLPNRQNRWATPEVNMQLAKWLVSLKALCYCN